MLKIGITGGIGSGKTTVCRIFEALGIPVYYADQEARKLMVSKPILIEQIKQLFGQEAYQNGQINRPYIANIVFQDKKKLNQLNDIVHPAIGDDFLEWADSQVGAPYVVEEAAVMIESGNHQLMDKIILVTAPIDIKVERVKKRDQTTEEQIQNRIKSQLSDEERMPFIDYVIENDNVQHLIPQIINLHKTFLQL